MALATLPTAGHHTLVHRWVEAEKVPEAPVSTAYAFEIDLILARIHALDVEWIHVSIEGPTSQDWPELARRAAATGQPWADELAGHVETFLAIAHFVDTCERPGPVVLTHRDIQPWNLLARDGWPVVLDWELSGMLDLAGPWTTACAASPTCSADFESSSRCSCDSDPLLSRVPGATVVSGWKLRKRRARRSHNG